MNDHIFADNNNFFITCSICGIFKSNSIIKSCREMLDISNTHTWIKIPENERSTEIPVAAGRYWVIKDPYYCEICNITAIETKANNITIFDYYTCNEYLMIKVNE